MCETRTRSMFVSTGLGWVVQVPVSRAQAASRAGGFCGRQGRLLLGLRSGHPSAGTSKQSPGKRGTPRGCCRRRQAAPAREPSCERGWRCPSAAGRPGSGTGSKPYPHRVDRRGGRRRRAAIGASPQRHLAAARGQWGRAAGWWRRRRRRGAEAGTSRPRPGPAQRVAPAGHGARGGDGGRAAEEVALVGLGGTHERAHQARLANRHPLYGRRRRDHLLQETRDQELQRWVRGRPGPLSWQVRSARALFTAAPAGPRRPIGEGRLRPGW